MPGKMQPPPHTDVNGVLDQLERVVRWSEEFQLVFVKCNHPVQQEALRRAFLARLHDKRVLEVVLEQPIVSLLNELTIRRDSAAPPQAVCVYHLEKSINEQREASPVLGRLNHDRDLLRQAVPATLLLWLPDFALDCIARGAPDFWAWRSGVYEFPTARKLWHVESAIALTPETSALFSLPLEDKQKEIARLSELLRTARALPRQGKRERQTAAHLWERLALLHYSLGERDKAQEFLVKTLTLYQELHDQQGVAGTYHKLGVLAQDRGAYEEALEWYRRSLALSEELGNRADMAISYHQLGMIAQDRGAYEEALEWYRRSLALSEELGNRADMAASYSQIGALFTTCGTPDAAVSWSLRSLLIRMELRSPAIRTDLHWLAQQRQQLGDTRFLGLLREQLSEKDAQTILRLLNDSVLPPEA
jgi:tetratricopeptide (TPR) repeat protein